MAVLGFSACTHAITLSLQPAARRSSSDSTEIMQIEVHKTVAARPPAVFKIVADIMNWPQIMD